MTTLEIASYLMVAIGGCLVLILLLCAIVIWQEISSKRVPLRYLNVQDLPPYPKPPVPPAPPPKRW